jgi:hypothetical protein
MLGALAVRNATPKDKSYKLTDGKGLYLHISPSGKKTWRYRFAIAGSESSPGYRDRWISHNQERPGSSQIERGHGCVVTTTSEKKANGSICVVECRKGYFNLRARRC